MTSASVTTIGIMFDSIDDQPFPRLKDLGYEWTGEFDYPEELTDWFVVAHDPNRLSYFDEDSEAMDTTNWDTIVGGLTDLPDVQVCGQNVDGRYIHDYVDVDIEDALEKGYALVGKVLCVAPDAEELDEMIQYGSALADYPLLDDEAYYALESEAWDRYVDDGLRYDTIGDLEESLDEETIESIEAAWMDVAGAACEHLASYDGWSGSHSPDFDRCIGAEIIRHLCLLFLGAPADQPYFGYDIA